MPGRRVSFKFKHSTIMSFKKMLILLLFGLSTLPSLIFGASIGDFLIEQTSNDDSSQSASSDCDIRQCFSQGRFSLESMTCPQIRKTYSCLRKLSCQGNLEYHTALTLTNNERRRCSSDVGTNIRSGDTSNPQQSLQYRSKNSYRRPPYEQLTGLPLEYCYSAALNYTIGSPVSSMQQFLAHKKATAIPEHRIANHEELYRSESKSRTERVRRSSDLFEASQAALQLMKSHQARSTETQTRNEDSKQLQKQLMSNLLYVSKPFPTPMITCIIFGDPHLRTFDSRYQTCNSLGTRPLIEHPLFDVQITNSRLKEKFNTTGVTKVTVLVRGFGPCHINSNLLYESDSIAQVQLSATFTDGSVNNFGNMVYIKTSSENQVVTIHMDHIGARIYISQFEGTHFLNIVVKFRSDMSYHPILNAISSMSMCKSGCHPREVVDLKQVLTDAGVDIDGQKEDEDVKDDAINNQQSTNIYSNNDNNDNEQQVGHRTRTFQTKQNNDNLSDDYDGDEDYLEHEEGIRSRKQSKMRFKRDGNGNNNNNKQKSRKNRNKNRKNKNKNRKQQNTKPAGVEDAFHMLRSSSLSQPEYYDPTELMRSGEMKSEQIQELTEELLPESPYEKCEDMREYYRLTCLYDVAVKGISNTNPHLFAASFEERRLDGDFSYIFDNTYYSSSSRKISSDLFFVFVTVLFAILSNLLTF